ncbi:MAG: HDOD domain-containing protein [Thermoleophilia bacterium]
MSTVEDREAIRAHLVERLRERLVLQVIAMPQSDPLALGRVRDVCDDQEAPLDEVAHAVAGNPGLAALLLRLANSAAFAGTTQIHDLSSAVVRLGRAMVRSLTFVLPAMDLLRAPDDGLREARVRLQRHAIRVGLVARALTRDEKAADAALAAGILHDLGMSALSVHAPIGFRRVVEGVEAGGDLLELERRIFGFDHTEFGYALALAWSYPGPLAGVIRDHELDEPPDVLTATVRVADALVCEHGEGVESPGHDLGPALALLGITRAEADEAAGATLEAARGGGSAPTLIALLDDL